MTVNSPPGAPGTVDVTVVTPAGTSPTGAADQFTYANAAWFQASPTTSPTLRFESAEAYDPATGQTIEFGGASSAAGPWLNDTWDWNGANWVQLFPANSPPARDGASIAYDPAMGNGDLVLFGGYNGTTTLSDTWAWTGTNWVAQSPATVPPARQLAGMAYDAGVAQIVLFGGMSSTGTALNDTWEWSGTNWVAKSPANQPGARWDDTMAFDPAWGTSGELVLYGGVSGGGGDGDTWIWTGTNWLQDGPEDSPGTRWQEALAYDSATGQLLLYGGWNGSALGDTWALNSSTTWGQLAEATPPPARYTSMAYDTTTNQMVLFGGYGTAYTADTWLIGAPSVTALSTVSGPTAGGTSLTITGSGFTGLLASGDVMFGSTAATAYTISSATSLTLVASPPEPAGTVDVTVIGSAGTSPDTGADQFTYSNSTWYQAAPTTAPSVRSVYAEAYDQATGQTILFGGATTGGNYLNDTWDWNGANWAQLSPATSPGTRVYCRPGLRPGHERGRTGPVRRYQRHLPERHLGLERLHLGPGRRQWLHRGVHEQPFRPRRRVHGLRPGERRPTGPLRRFERRQPKRHLGLERLHFGPGRQHGRHHLHRGVHEQPFGSQRGVHGV